MFVFVRYLETTVLLMAVMEEHGTFFFNVRFSSPISKSFTYSFFSFRRYKGTFYNGTVYFVGRFNTTM